MQFSIIIPAKNEEAHIGRCLDSIANADWDRRQYEVIVVDNGSTDRTAAIARDKGVQIYVKPQLTISGLRNFGALNSTGKILAFLDADCAVDRNWLKAASLYLDETDGISAFGSPVVIPDGATWVQKAWYNVRGKPNLVEEVGWLESANLFVKRKAFFSVNGFNESLITCEDYELTQRLKMGGRLISDYRVRATHYREPANIYEFIKKEVWRGKSNYNGLLKRRIDLAEIPSLVMPIMYGLFMLSFAFLVVHSVHSSKNYVVGIFVLFLWQFPLIGVSIRKGKTAGLMTVCQLYVLFNAYFFARTLSLLRRK
jgi:glycosyltransferase involved in cell wall biosynthesis